jgi:hypothetical protein
MFGNVEAGLKWKTAMFQCHGLKLMTFRPCPLGLVPTKHYVETMVKEIMLQISWEES